MAARNASGCGLTHSISLVYTAPSIRDEVLNLIDGAVYTSEIEWVKPHPEAFRAAMAAVGETDPSACVFVGDRPYDDIHGAKSAGMRAVLVANSAVPAFAAA